MLQTCSSPLREPAALKGFDLFILQHRTSEQCILEEINKHARNNLEKPWGKIGYGPLDTHPLPTDFRFSDILA